MHVLIAEDEKKLTDLLKKGLEAENHSVSIALNGRDALKMALAFAHDAIVLDLMLPVANGIEVLRRLRKRGNKTPILVLSARGTVADVVKSLDMGADDYIAKPFAFEEFLARLRSVSRRGLTARPRLLRVGDLVLNPATYDAIRAGKEIALSRMECRVLEILMRRAGQVVPRRELALAVWPSTDDMDKNKLNVYINLLRNKVDRDNKVKLIKTVRRLGYAIRDPAKAR